MADSLDTGSLEIDSQSTKGLLQESLVQRILHRFIDMLDKHQQRLSIKVCRKETKELFEFNDYDTEYLWSLIDIECDQHYSVLKVVLNKKNGVNDVIYNNATLCFNRDQEALVRSWLNRPVVLTKTQEWQQALMTLQHLFTETQLAVLQNASLNIPTKTAEYSLQALYRVGQCLRQASSPISLRTLASQCFDGDSKVLDRHSRMALLSELYPESISIIKPRALLLSVRIPQVYKQVLFIENQETFLDLCESNHSAIDETVLVYSAGFRAAAHRSRQVGCVRFAVVDMAVNANTVDGVSKKAFEQWWFSNDTALPCYFWGDLDFSGMTILASLRQAFPQLEAWQFGYDIMLKYHQQGVGHSLEQAGKQEQKDPVQTYCAYADTVLLPLLRDSQRCVDQEIVSFID